VAWAPIKLSPRIRYKLAILALLALLPLDTCVGGLIEPRSNTAGIDVGGDFDANRAFPDLKRLASFGPRPPGSRALERSREFIAGELRGAGAAVALGSFTASTPLGPIPMTNLVAKVPGTSSSAVIIAGHYDTKRMDSPFVGANDGGSSAAFLLKMARVLARRKNSLGYWLVFFDGEEALGRWSKCGRPVRQSALRSGTFASRHFEPGPGTDLGRHDRGRTPRHSPRSSLNTLADRYRVRTGPTLGLRPILPEQSRAHRGRPHSISRTWRAQPPETVHLEREEIESTLASLPSTGRRALRDRAPLLFLYNSGARVQEVADFRAVNIQFGPNPSVHLHGQGR
jgi:hypothetical protein